MELSAVGRSAGDLQREAGGRWLARERGGMKDAGWGPGNMPGADAQTGINAASYNQLRNQRVRIFGLATTFLPSGAPGISCGRWRSCLCAFGSGGTANRNVR